MNELVMMAMAVGSAVLGFVVAWFIFRRSIPHQEIFSGEQLSKTERRLTDELGRVRETFDTNLRESHSSNSKLQVDLITLVTTKLESSRESLESLLTGRLENIRISQEEALSNFRKSQDERLSGAEKAIIQLSEGLQKAFGVLEKNVLQILKDESVRQSNDSTSLKQELVKALSQFGERLNESQGLVRKELNDTLKELSAEVSKALSETRDKMLFAHGESRREMSDLLKAIKTAQESSKDALGRNLSEFQKNVETQLRESREDQGKRFDSLTATVATSLDAIRTDSETKLEKIRETVSEKLQTTLEARLGESFTQVSLQLEQVFKGLGEMQALATGVGDLKRVLTNVRSRGTFGETQLATLLEQVLAPAQYEKNCATKPGSSERVEFAVRFPSKDEGLECVYLPIDAKFPREDYERLLNSYEAGDTAGLETARKSLRQRLTIEAATIREKYISPPNTLDLALMFLPTEGLYAEALRLDGLAEELQSEKRVVIVGPTTLYAVLNSFQMGFQTLAIQKRSSEVWRILGAVKTEFGKFGESLKAVDKRLEQAHNSIDDTLRRSRSMERKLREVESLPPQDAAMLLPESTVAEEVDDAE
jgi:DNA recombination protein RmuC